MYQWDLQRKLTIVVNYPLGANIKGKIVKGEGLFKQRINNSINPCYNGEQQVSHYLKPKDLKQLLYPCSIQN